MKRWSARRFAVLAVALLPATAALAECPVPIPPPVSAKPARPTLPARPACLDAKGGGCPGWEAYSYNDAIKAYNTALGAWKPLADGYVAQLNAYVTKSNEYARCEVQSLQ